MNQRNKDKGFSILEVLIAMAIFAVGILGTLAFNGIILTNNDLTGSAVNAQALAQSQVEGLLALPITAPELTPCLNLTDFCHEDIGSGEDGGANSGLPLSLEGFSAGAGVPGWVGRFRREWTVTSSTTPGDPRILRVRVRWNDTGIDSTRRSTTRRFLVTTNL